LNPGSGESSLEVHAQPILDLVSGALSGYEALARFRRFPAAGPDDWFAAAHRAGCGARLEAVAVARALRLGADRPAGTVLSVNVSPNVIDSPELAAVLPGDLSGLQFEMTEHQLADDDVAMLKALDRLRQRGARIAVDDVGAGYAGFKRLMAVSPDVLKLDRALITGVSREPRKIAMVEAIVHFAAQTGARVCAEGLETVEDLAAVTELAVGLGQGWVIGKPAAAFGSVEEIVRKAWTPSGTGGVIAQLRDLAEVLETLSEVRELPAAAAVLANAAGLLGCDAVRLAVLSPGALRLFAQDGGQVCERLERAPAAGRVIEERAVEQLLASTVPPGSAEQGWLATTGCRSMVLFPLVSAGRTVGILACGRRHEHLWSRAELRPARTVAAAAGALVSALNAP
jgi:EAL domain-containing protein (putative c-di-GMP-specific phosphodiesterase class I)